MKRKLTVRSLANLYSLAAQLTPTQRHIVAHLGEGRSNTTGHFSSHPIAKLAALGFVRISETVELTPKGRSVVDICVKDSE